MNVLALTIMVSSCLTGLFIVCFALELGRNRRSSPERDSLLPLDPAAPPAIDAADATTGHPKHL